LSERPVIDDAPPSIEISKQLPLAPLAAEALPGGTKQPGPDSFGRRCSSAVAMSRNVPLIILDPLYSTHDQDENDTRAMAALALQRSKRISTVERIPRGV